MCTTINEQNHNEIDRLAAIGLTPVVIFSQPGDDFDRISVHPVSDYDKLDAVVETLYAAGSWGQVRIGHLAPEPQGVVGDPTAEALPV